MLIGNKCEKNNFLNWPYGALKHGTLSHICTLFFSDPQHLQKQDSAYSPESCVYYCTLCDYSTKARLNLVQHARSARHQQNEGLRKLQLHQQGLGGDEDGLSLHELFHVKECPSSQGLCFFNFLCLFAWVVVSFSLLTFRLFWGCVHISCVVSLFVTCLFSHFQFCLCLCFSKSWFLV